VPEIGSYTAYEVYDPHDSVTVQWDPDTYTVSAFTSSTNLIQSYTATVPLSAFPDLEAPSPSGSHTLAISLVSMGREMASEAAAFSTCEDSDGDGFCAGEEDCDDSDPSVSPESSEVCDGKDNDCDGQIDEDFRSAGSKIGNPCGVGLCSGIFVCTPDGENVVCNNIYSPGELPEYCGDGIDNDCDGVTDETVELSDGRQRVACICKEGETRACGEDVGTCQKGVQTCTGGEWGPCQNQVLPSAEISNGLDDNCDGIVDNVGGGTSAVSSGCQCYGNGQPGEEVCNDIDDDCDGQIDEGISCCREGESRECGISVGACESGIQECIGESWGPCMGSIEPVQEICFNDIDDSCDGRVDEGCENLERTCTNGVLDEGEEGTDCGGFCPNTCGEFSLFIILTLAGIAVLAATAALFKFRILKTG
jgi:hypothetical protein